ncbi:hypothetical protein FHL15_009677 [Xylaria flabelliformis]|uniref:RNA polymerase II assembly factor Rtp1 C-terminal domain-containing protein n=1 Tax=Xylaria flabelliformis TaxID=2512241 RepID=A0A553HN45_9PEZI|nr:hypothetical protein FHL15_009677 [Xylaria flabelliformis]
MDAKRAAEQEETLVSALERIGTKAFHPTADAQSRTDGQKEFGAIISRTGTLALMSALNTMIKPGRVPDWLRVRFMDILMLLPQRPDGVRATLEFVFSVHPSSTASVSEAATPQKQGANITMEALKMASTLLSVPPTSVKPEIWFPGIAPQLLTLLDGNDGPDLAKVAAYVIGFGVLGTPGWRAFAEPMLACINPSLSSQEAPAEPMVFSAGLDEVIDLRKRTILVRADALHIALKRLSSLLNSHPNPGLTKRLLSPLLLPLWALSSWPSPTAHVKERYCGPALALIEIYLRLAGSAEKFLEITDNLLFSGFFDSREPRWSYEHAGSPGIQIKRLHGDELAPPLDLDVMDLKIPTLIELITRTASDSDLSTLFLKLFETSLGSRQDTKTIQVTDDIGDGDPVMKLIRARMLQEMMEQLPDRLISNSKQLLKLIDKVLSEFGTEYANDDAVPVALSLLNLVITVPSFQRKDVPESTLRSIEDSLSRISLAREVDTSQTARNLSQLLKYRDELEDPADRPIAPTDQQIEDRKTYNLALSYITQADSPPPVRSEGLNLLGTLIKSGSAILDIPATLVLLSSLLSDDDEYISLRVIKVFVQLSERHPRSTTREVLDQYVDASEKQNTDTRLRFGEALLQLMQRLGETFAGEISASVGEALLALAGRRAHRPKTEEQQARAERVAARRLEAKAKLAGRSHALFPPHNEDDDDDVDMDLEEQTPEERTRNALLARIVSGWESKRGSEDMRIRASALSLFASGLETNIRSFSPSLIDAALALSLDVLMLEAGVLEAGILRRAAVSLVLTFVNALGKARERGSHFDFGSDLGSRKEAGLSFGGGFTTKEEDVVRILGYVEQTDEDGLVRQHAQDALESLESLRLVQLVPQKQDQDATPPVVRIAGLDMTRPSLPVLDADEGRRARPRIEEVE